MRARLSTLSRLSSGLFAGAAGVAGVPGVGRSGRRAKANVMGHASHWGWCCGRGRLVVDGIRRVLKKKGYKKVTLPTGAGAS
jgi:hypothetical protein